MRRLILIAALVLASSSALAQTKPAPKPAAKPAAAKPEAKPAPARADFRDPEALVALLADMGAKTTLAKPTESSVGFRVETPGGAFGGQFVSCDPKGKACRMLAFSTGFERKGPNLAEINMFNRTEVACRGFMTDDGKANVMYSTLLTARMNAEEMREHVGVWQGCLVAFRGFTVDPVGYMSAH